ncbi:MAG: hypothetical protein Q8930_04590 [Bacillota bacterium]|nr:hypothetical protein [Bacillota bacterium]
MSKHKKSTKYEDEGSPTANQPINNFNLGSLAGIVNGIDVNSLVEAINSAGEAIDNAEADEVVPQSGNADIIRALRTLVNADKVLLLQTVIQIYALSRTQRKEHT